MRVIAVTPAWNEVSSIRAVVEGVLQAGFDVVVVDDGSTDETVTEVLRTHATLIRMPFNMGVGGALRCGFKFAVRSGFDTVIQVDADGQHPAAHLGTLIEACLSEEADMVIGSRFAPNSGSTMDVNIARRFAMRTLARAASSAVGSPITDASSGFRLIRGRLLEELAEHLPAYYLGDTFEAVVAAGRAGYKVVEVPVPLTERSHGTSSASTMQAARWAARAFVTSALRVHPRLAAP